MSCLHYKSSALFIENVSLQSIAETYDTPCYVYSKATIENNWKAFSTAFSTMSHKICYAVKANSNLAILNILANLGSGFDIVSQGELERVLKAGGDVKKIVFSGVGKRETEIEYAIQKGIYCFDVESEAELKNLQNIAHRLNANINFALRINPNINPYTHKHISTGLKENKFGIDFDDVLPLCQNLTMYPNLKLIGIACHIGSQIMKLEPFVLAIDRLVELYLELINLNIELKTLNIGGGLGIAYGNERPPEIMDYANALRAKIAKYPLEIILEPGRAIVGNAGVLLTKVEYLKASRYKNFAIVDAGMNDFIRPALYDAWQDILPVNKTTAPKVEFDIAGPVCESADFLGKDRELAVSAGDLLAIDAAGAYGFSMCSNYNSRCKPCEVLVSDKQTYLIRPREVISDLFASEKMLSEFNDAQTKKTTPEKTY